MQFTGLRPGEKLSERLWVEGDKVLPTAYPKILRLEPRYALNGHFQDVIDSLAPICSFDPQRPDLYRDRRALRRTLKRIIPTLRLPDDEPPR